MAPSPGSALRFQARRRHVANRHPDHTSSARMFETPKMTQLPYLPSKLEEPELPFHLIRDLPLPTVHRPS